MSLEQKAKTKIENAKQAILDSNTAPQNVEWSRGYIEGVSQMFTDAKNIIEEKDDVIAALKEPHADEVKSHVWRGEALAYKKALENAQKHEEQAIAEDKRKTLETLLATVEGSPFREMACQIEIGMKNLQRNWKKKAITDEDFRRIISKMYVPIDDVRGTILHFGTFEEEYQTDLTRLQKANEEKFELLKKLEEKCELQKQKIQQFLKEIDKIFDEAYPWNRNVNANYALHRIRLSKKKFEELTK